MTKSRKAWSRSTSIKISSGNSISRGRQTTKKSDELREKMTRWRNPLIKCANKTKSWPKQSAGSKTTPRFWKRSRRSLPMVRLILNLKWNR